MGSFQKLLLQMLALSITSGIIVMQVEMRSLTTVSVADTPNPVALLEGRLRILFLLQPSFCLFYNAVDKELP